jgi:hypothetical protein
MNAATTSSNRNSLGIMRTWAWKRLYRCILAGMSALFVLLHSQMLQSLYRMSYNAALLAAVTIAAQPLFPLQHSSSIALRISPMY